ARTPACGTCSPIWSRRSTTSFSTWRRTCAKCGRDSVSMNLRSSSTPSAVEIARRLIACPSVTPDEGGALLYLRDLLAEAGFAVEIVAFAEPGLPTIDNLYARIGTRAPHIVFAGHTDV